MRDNINRVWVSVSAQTGEEMWTEDNYNRCKNGDKKGRTVHTLVRIPADAEIAQVKNALRLDGRAFRRTLWLPLCMRILRKA